ncbi:MAG: DUF58 domain-containing protein [Clostridiales bacterium]|nr:DUF58 domain-containing protein [Clostridiales bacterium]
MNRKGLAIYLCGAALFLCLYFFENNTGTRIVLLCSVLIPLMPTVRRAVSVKDTAVKTGLPVQTVKTFSRAETDEPGDIRAYLPGDPVNRIHWKLSAKRDELLVRPPLSSFTVEEKTEKSSESAVPAKHYKKLSILIGLIAIALSLILLFVIPQARYALEAICNRVFQASEAVNSYVYEYYPVSSEQPVWPAVLFLGIILGACIGITVITGSRLMSLLLTSGCVVYQVYFGLSFYAWINIALFVVFALAMLKRPFRRKSVTMLVSAVLIISLGIAIFWPGVDAETERLSEKLRDRLSLVTESIAGGTREDPTGEKETRHVHTESLLYGNETALANKEYRLVTREEEEISMPRYVNYLRTALLLMLVVVLLILPFLPFFWLNARRKKALRARMIFGSEDKNAAVYALFQHVIAWLEASGYSEGNLPYRDWPQNLVPRLSEDYARRFKDCVAVFEEAAYSDHVLSEHERQQVYDLMRETEKLMKEKADTKHRLLLKYRDCLWI